MHHFLYRHTVRLFLTTIKSDKPTHIDAYFANAMDNLVLEHLGASPQTPGIYREKPFPSGLCSTTPALSANQPGDK